MDANHVVLQGTIDSNGSLRLDDPIPLAPGPVAVTIQSVSKYADSNDPFWQAMNEIWAGQHARGHMPRSKERIDAEIAALRSEAEQEMLAIEQTHAECRYGEVTVAGSREEPR